MERNLSSNETFERQWVDDRASKPLAVAGGAQKSSRTDAQMLPNIEAAPSVQELHDSHVGTVGVRGQPGRVDGSHRRPGENGKRRTGVSASL